MKRIAKLLPIAALAALLLAPAAFAAGGGAAVVDDDPAQDTLVVASAASQAFFLDTREGPRESDGSETLTYSILWSGGGDGEVRILQDGVEIAGPAELAEMEGEWDWSVQEAGTYVLKHVTLMGDETNAVETATFIVPGSGPGPGPGPEPDPLPPLKAALAWKYAKNANGWHCAQLSFTWHPEYKAAISDMRLLFADRKGADGKLSAYFADPSKAIDPLATTEKYGGKTCRAVPVNLKPFAKLADGRRAVFGVSDATLKSATDSVPAAERKICLRVANRDLSTVAPMADGKLAVLAWKENGRDVYLPVGAPAKPTTFTVRFSANGGTGKMSALKATVGAAAKLPANAFKRKGWVFLGWALRPDGPVAYRNGASAKDIAKAGKTATLYAKWAKKAYKVKFFANDGTDATVVQKMAWGKKAKLKANAFKRKGYVFAGWAKSKAAAKKGKVAYKDGKAVKNLVADGKTVKLFAVWKKGK